MHPRTLEDTIEAGGVIQYFKLIQAGGVIEFSLRCEFGGHFIIGKQETKADGEVLQNNLCNGDGIGITST